MAGEWGLSGILEQRSHETERRGMFVQNWCFGCGALGRVGEVDGDELRKGWRLWWPIDKALWMLSKRLIKGLLPDDLDHPVRAVMDLQGREQGQANVMVLVVVPVEPAFEVLSCHFQAGKAFWKQGMVFGGFEMSFAKGVVVADARTAVRAPNVETVKEGIKPLAGHWGAAIRMDGELAGIHTLALDCMPNQALGSSGRLGFFDGPTDHEAAKEVQQHIETEHHPLARARELGDIPAPDLPRSHGDELGFGVVGMASLGAAFLNGVILLEDAVHGADGAQVGASLE